MTELGISLLLTAALISTACAIMAYKTFYRFRRSFAAKIKAIGYILLAISLGLFSVAARVLTDFPLEIRIGLNVTGLLVMDIALVCLLLGLVDLYRKL